jgi:hypothetical protein
MVGSFLEAHGQGDPPRDLSQRPDLIDAIKAYLAAHNENPRPLKWTGPSDQTLEKARRGRVSLDAIAGETETDY